ncbi:MAG TPA: hypothetical protein VLJ61_09560 [Pyrinomonadaceae bacterium]|nr:hypothetical protein [Pyrinomonadaceae bacterium]
MVTSDLAFFTRDESLFGDNIARTKRIISKLLLDWTMAKDAVLKDGQFKEQERPNYLNAIYFDKLAEFFCRIWDELNDQGKVRYPSALKSRRGFHGPGRAIRINRTEDERRSLGVDPSDLRRNDWAFTTEIVEKLKPSLGNARMLFGLNGEPWSSNCKIFPEIDPSQWEAWLSDQNNGDSSTVFLTPVELEYVDEISRLISSLNSKELRVLGTHYCAEETSEDIKFNLRVWNNRFNDIIKFQSRRMDIERATYQLVTTVREVKRKAAENRKLYATALDKCISGCKSRDVKSAILAKQKESDEIWDDDLIERFRLVAEAMLSFSIYIRRGFSEIEANFILKGKELQESDKIYTSILRPLPNVVLQLREYQRLKPEDAHAWIKELVDAKNTLFRFVPPLTDLSGIGIT